jgi:XRE family transcriptional regulator, regulator of sulfur utilization
MDTLIDKASQNIAHNLIKLRKSMGLTQQQLAKTSGMTRAAIALLESGSANPTLESMLKITQGLKISIEELLANPWIECQLIKAADIPRDKRSRSGIILKKLLPDKLPATEFDELTLEPNLSLTGAPHIDGAREYFTCIQGKILVGVLGQKFIIQKGDVLSFPGDKPHSYKNIGSTLAKGISVVLFQSLQ